MDKALSQQLGFEVLEVQGNSITFKRVLRKKNEKKDRFNEEMALPKLTMHSFYEEEIDRLQRIELEIVKEIIAREKKSAFRKLIDMFR